MRNQAKHEPTAPTCSPAHLLNWAGRVVAPGIGAGESRAKLSPTPVRPAHLHTMTIGSGQQVAPTVSVGGSA